MRRVWQPSCFDSAGGGFSRQYPDIKVEITTDDKLADIVGEAFDAGVRPSAIVEKI